jgi:hypothetical protein
MHRRTLTITCASLLIGLLCVLSALNAWGGDDDVLRGGVIDVGNGFRSAEFLSESSHSSDVTFLRDTVPMPLPPAAMIPLLTVFVRAGTRFLERCVRSINFPVRVLLIVQDSEDDKTVAPLVARLRDELTGAGRMVESIRHVINPVHTGCSGAWNTVFRLYPAERFWILSSNDMAFPPGQLGAFYERTRAAAGDPDVGMVSASTNFGGSAGPSTSFGLRTWAVMRQGVLRAGLYDENFYPGYFEDDDIVWRFWMAGLRFYAFPEVAMIHGDGAGSFQTGTTLEDKTGEWNAEQARSASMEYYHAKWGPMTKQIDYNWLAAPGNREKVLAACADTTLVHERFCTPFDSGRFVGAWGFSVAYRACVRDGPGRDFQDCKHLVPTRL